MAKIRIHEFAKQIDKNAGDIVKALQDNGYAVKSHMSSISDEEIAFIQKKFGLGNDDKKAEVKAEKTEAKVEVKETKTEAKAEVAEAKEEKKAENNADKKDEAEAPKKKKFVVVNHRPDAPKKKRPEGERPKKKRPEGDRVVKPVKKDEGEKDTVKTNTDVKVNKQENTPKNEDKVASAQTADNTVKNTETNNAGNKPQPSKAPSSDNRERSNDNRDRNNDNRDRNGNRDNRDRNGNRDNRDRNNDNRDRNGNRDNRDRNGNRDNRDNRDRNGNRDNRDRNGNRDNRDNRDRNGGRGFRKEDNVPAADVSTDKNRKGRQDKLKYDKEKRRDDNDNELKKGKKGRNKNQPKVPVLERPVKKKEEPKEEVIKVITIPETLTIGELADKMKIQASALIKKLFLSGQIVTLNTEIDFETAENIAIEYDIIAEKEEVVDVIEELLKEEDDAEETLVKRPPVVCVMGHVDHGKTSLLDAIRETNVISGEAGGITQHIGAYVVTINGEKITFLDTPGHEAFTAMRMRGAQSTDIAILVVAADDGVMPQTVEAINHAKAAGIEIIVAINKIDKPSANIERVKKELTEYELIPEDWGGSTICVPVSAHSREGIDNLLEMVLLQAEVLELKANPNRMARGLIIEAKLDKGRGSVANILIQKGTLHVGDCIAVGSNYGKVRAMTDERGNKLKEAGPSTPVEILGLNGVPNAGDTFVVTKNEKEARNFAETFIRDSKIKMLEGTKKGLSLDDLFTQIQAGDVKEFNIVVKADVQGSVEAVKQSLTKLSNDEVVVKIIHGGVGAINESDVILASASNAIIIGFNTRPDNQAKEIADNESVDIRLYNVIYKAIEDVEAAMKGLLDPVFEEKVIGHAEIRQTFKASGVGTIAGSYVLDGIFERGCSARITRDGEQIFDGPLASLKRFQDDVKEVKAGFECGLVFEKFNDLKEGDLIESYKMVEVPR